MGRIRGGLAAGLLGAAITLTGCTGENPPPGAAAAPSTAATAAASAGASASASASTGAQQALAQGYQRALALAQFGGLGGTQGVGDEVKGLGPRIEQQGTDLQGRIRTLAQAQGVDLADGLADADAAALERLRGESGPAFDAAWLQAAQQLERQAREWANGVLNDPDASPEAKAAAKDLIAGLDGLAARLQAAIDARGGQGTGGQGAPGSGPTSVGAGTGGQAAGGGVLPAVLVGVGLGALVAGALGVGLRARRSARS